MNFDVHFYINRKLEGTSFCYSSYEVQLAAWATTQAKMLTKKYAYNATTAQDKGSDK